LPSYVAQFCRRYLARSASSPFLMTVVCDTLTV